MDQRDAWVGDAGARIHYGQFDLIYSSASGKMLMIDHDAETYQVFPVPFSMVDYLPASQKADFLDAIHAMAHEVHFEGPGPSETVGEYSARRYVATIRLEGGMGSFEIEAWVSPDLGERCAMLEQLERAKTGLNPLFGDVERRILDLPGCTVRRVLRQIKGGQRSATEERLVAIEDVPADPGRYAPPADYREEPVDQKYIGGIVAAQPMPAP